MADTPTPATERATRLARLVVPALKIALIVTIYFLLCVTIILAFVGAAP